MKSIFEYLDYRVYLKDFYEERKSSRSYFSYRLFGDRVGVDPSYLVKVFLKCRHISEKSIRKFAEFCGLAGKEAEYFDALVHFVKAKSHNESKLYFERLLSIKNVSAQRLLPRQYDYYQKWYHSAIRSVLEYHDFRGDYKRLAEQVDPPISRKEAKESMALLTALDLVAKDETGRYRITNAAVTTGPEWQSLAVQAFQEETIRLSHESLRRHPKKHRDVSTVTMNINGHDFLELRERIREFRESAIKFVSEANGPDRTYQLNIQFFPVSKVEGGRK
jgi:uncharacterized protein (TIGR02147 family)